MASGDSKITLRKRCPKRTAGIPSSRYTGPQRGITPRYDILGAQEQPFGKVSSTPPVTVTPEHAFEEGSGLLPVSTVLEQAYGQGLCPTPPVSAPPPKPNFSSKIVVKLLIDARNHKVLFAEAGKEFIDFMFSMLILPLGSVINLLSRRTMVGSIRKLYQSVENLKEAYLLPSRSKSIFRQPIIPSNAGVSSMLLSRAEAMNQITYYSCQSCHKKLTSSKNINCPTCKTVMSGELEFVIPSSSCSGAGDEWESVEGFVKGVVTYMITDDLEITPMSEISSITLINRFSMKKDVLLEEKQVTVGMEEGLALLESLLESQTALTNVFLTSSNKKEICKDM